MAVVTSLSNFTQTYEWCRSDISVKELSRARTGKLQHAAFCQRETTIITCSDEFLLKILSGRNGSPLNRQLTTMLTGKHYLQERDPPEEVVIAITFKRYNSS